MVLTLLERLYIYGRDGTFLPLASLSLSHISMPRHAVIGDSDANANDSR